MKCFKIDNSNIDLFLYFIKKLKKDGTINETWFNYVKNKAETMEEFIFAFKMIDGVLVINHIAPIIYLINNIYEEVPFIDNK